MAKSKNGDRLDSNNKSLGAWVKHLEETFQEDEVPEGWATIRDIANSAGQSIYAVRGRLDRMVQEGKAESRQFLIRLDVGVKKVSHYKLNDQ